MNEIKENIFNEVLESTSGKEIPEVLVHEAIKKVFEKISAGDSYIEVNEYINEVMEEIEGEYGDYAKNDNETKTGYYKLKVELENSFENYREELISKNVISDTIKFDENFEVTFDELNEKLNQNEKYLNEFFDLRDKKIEIIRDPELSLDEKKAKILELNNSSNLVNIKDEDIKREYELFTQSSDEVLLTMFTDDSITPDELVKKVEEYTNTWSEVVEDLYGVDLKHMNALSKQIEVVLDNANEELANEYTAICNELNFRKGSEEEKIFDEAFENNCDEQLYISKMTDIKINENDELKKIDEELLKIGEELIECNDDKETNQNKIIELGKQKNALLANKDKILDNLKNGLAEELHNRFERMANYQKRALRYAKLVEKFDEHKKYTVKSDLSQSVKKHDTLVEAMNSKNQKIFKGLKDRVSIGDAIEIPNEEIDTKEQENKDVEKKQADEQAKQEDSVSDKTEQQGDNESGKNDKDKNKDNDEVKNQDKSDKPDKTIKGSQPVQGGGVVYQQPPIEETTQPEEINNSILEISEPQKAKQIVEDFLGLTSSLKKDYLVNNDGFLKLNDAIELLGNNNEGYSLSRKERKDILNSINSEMKRSLNEDELNQKNDEVIDLFAKLNDGNRDESMDLFKELFTYDQSTSLPFISAALIEKKDQRKLAEMLNNYSELLMDGQLSKSEIENFERYIINPLNANVIKQGISDMGFLGKLKSKFSKTNIKPFHALNSALKDLNDVRTQISSGKFISGPIDLGSSVYSNEEVVRNEASRIGQEQNTPKVNPPQK